MGGLLLYAGDRPGGGGGAKPVGGGGGGGADGAVEITMSPSFPKISFI